MESIFFWREKEMISLHDTTCGINLAGNIELAGGGVN